MITCSICGIGFKASNDILIYGCNKCFKGYSKKNTVDHGLAGRQAVESPYAKRRNTDIKAV